MTEVQKKKVIVHCESDLTGVVRTPLESNYFIKKFVVTNVFIPNSIFNVTDINNVVTINKTAPPLVQPINITFLHGNYDFERIKSVFIASMQSAGINITRFAINDNLQLELTSDENFHFMNSTGVRNIFGFTDNDSILSSRYGKSHVSDYPFDLLYPRFIQIMSSQLSNQNVNIDQSMDCIMRVPVSAMPFGTMINYENPIAEMVDCDITTSYLSAVLCDENGIKINLNGKKWHISIILELIF